MSPRQTWLAWSAFAVIAGNIVDPFLCLNAAAVALIMAWRSRRLA